MNQAARYTPAYRRQQIITAASALFEAQGYEKTTVDQIARVAKLSQGTLYRYFKNKQAIFTACNQHHAILQVQTLPSSKTKAVAQERYQHLVKRLLGYCIAHNRYQKQLQNPSLDALQRDELATQIAPSIQELVEEEITTRGLYCKTPAHVAHLLAFAIMHSLPPTLDPTTEELAQYLEFLYRITDAILSAWPTQTGINVK